MKQGVNPIVATICSAGGNVTQRIKCCYPYSSQKFGSLWLEGIFDTLSHLTFEADASLAGPLN